LNEIILYVIRKNKLKIKIKSYKKIKKNCLRGNNHLAKKLLNWSPKKNIFKAADEIYKIHKK